MGKLLNDFIRSVILFYFRFSSDRFHSGRAIRHCGYPVLSLQDWAYLSGM